MATGSGEGFTFVWRIENFSFSAEKECIPSPVFKSINQNIWKISLYPSLGSNVIGYCLYKESQPGPTTSLKVDYELSLVASDRSSHQTFLCKDCSFPYDALLAGKMHIVSRSTIFKMKNLFLPNDVLTIQCRIWHKKCVTAGKKFARTRIGVDSWKFTWIENNFSDCSTKNEILFVKSTSDLRPSWNIQVAMCPDSLGDECIRFDIAKDNNVKCAIFKVDIIDSQGKTVEFAFDQYFCGPTNQKWLVISSISKKTLLDNASRFLPNDVLTLQCECLISRGVTSNYLEDMACESSFMKSTTSSTDLCFKVTGENSIALSAGLQFLYRERKLCDSSLQTKTETFPVHKAVLGARSSVFCTMFEHKLKENQANVVDIPDLDNDTVKRMLDYMYTDTIEALEWESASKLYYAADKYALISLKKKCSSFFQETVDVSNVCQMMVLADMHHDQDLISTLVNYISKHGKEIFDSEDWRSLETTHCKLANETLRVVFMKQLECSASK